MKNVKSDVVRSLTEKQIHPPFSTQLTFVLLFSGQRMYDPVHRYEMILLLELTKVKHFLSLSA